MATINLFLLNNPQRKRLRQQQLVAFDSFALHFRTDSSVLAMYMYMYRSEAKRNEMKRPALVDHYFILFIFDCYLILIFFNSKYRPYLPTLTCRNFIARVFVCVFAYCLHTCSRFPYTKFAFIDPIHYPTHSTQCSAVLSCALDCSSGDYCLLVCMYVCT